MESSLLSDIDKKEQSLGLYDESVIGIPFWRLVRFQVRVSYLREHDGFINKTVTDRIDLKNHVKNFFRSLYEFLRILLKGKKFKHVIFAFPRLQKVRGVFVDKFTDPVIRFSKIQENYIIFQRHQAGKHWQPRYDTDHIVKTDFFEILIRLIGFCIYPFVIIIYGKSVYRTYRKAKNMYRLGIKHLLLFFFQLSVFLVHVFLWYQVLKKIKAKCIFVVNRQNFFPQICACKKLNITAYELQHGITCGDSALYTGPYDTRIDPDFFLAFGDRWVGPQFGISVNKIINIGWAYKMFIEEDRVGDNLFKNAVLVISSPEISVQICTTVSALAEAYPELEFHVRLHPQEELTSQQVASICKNRNIQIKDNKEESSVALLAYQYVIGENSSVLYEALTLGKKVGKICFNGLNVEPVNRMKGDGFYYIESIPDFNSFLNEENRQVCHGEEFYADFKVHVVNELK